MAPGVPEPGSGPPRPYSRRRRGARDALVHRKPHVSCSDALYCPAGSSADDPRYIAEPKLDGQRAQAYIAHESQSDGRRAEPRSGERTKEW
jgi:hypothetical protein